MSEDIPPKQTQTPGVETFIEVPLAVIEGKRHFSVVWIIPVIAIFAAAWLVYQTLSKRGPLIEITFTDAGGIEAGKTMAKYHGVEIGTVKSLELSKDLSFVNVKLQLFKHAENLAKEGSSFWVVRPHISLGKVSGLDTLVSGVYIGVVPGEGAETTSFKGLERIPMIRAGEPGLNLFLNAKHAGSISVGSPIYYRRIVVGSVQDIELSDDMDQAIIEIYIEEKYQKLITQKTSFYRTARLEVIAGPGMLNVDLDSLESLIQGGIGLDHFDDGSHAAPAHDNDKFTLYNTRYIAENAGLYVDLYFENSSGVNPGRTIIKHQGLVVGVIESLDFDGSLNRIKARATIRSEAADLLKGGARYWLVRPKAGWEGVTGADTLFSGVYLEAMPGSGEVKESFKVTDWAVTDGITTENPDGLLVKLLSSNLKVVEGAPVYYKNVPVGRVVGIGLTKDATKAEVKLLIYKEYSHLVRENSVFWDYGGVNANFGFLGMGASLSISPLEALVAGGISFATPEDPTLAPMAKPGQKFIVADKPQPEWLKWSPSIPAK